MNENISVNRLLFVKVRKINRCVFTYINPCPIVVGSASSSFEPGACNVGTCFCCCCDSDCVDAVVET